jgi:hypothetical protein
MIRKIVCPKCKKLTGLTEKLMYALIARNKVKKTKTPKSAQSEKILFSSP